MTALAGWDLGLGWNLWKPFDRLKRQTDALKIFHFLIKRNIPYTTEFVPFLELCVKLGCPSLPHLFKGENAKYTNRRPIDEFLQYMGETVEKEVLCKFKDLLTAGFMMNEGTDRAVWKKVVQCV